MLAAIFNIISLTWSVVSNLMLLITKILLYSSLIVLTVFFFFFFWPNYSHIDSHTAISVSFSPLPVPLPQSKSLSFLPGTTVKALAGLPTFIPAPL